MAAAEQGGPVARLVACKTGDGPLHGSGPTIPPGGTSVADHREIPRDGPARRGRHDALFRSWREAAGGGRAHGIQRRCHAASETAQRANAAKPGARGRGMEIGEIMARPHPMNNAGTTQGECCRARGTDGNWTRVDRKILWSPAASSSQQRARVLTDVKARRFAPPPLRGADGLDVGSAHARPDWLLPTMPPHTPPTCCGRRPVQNDTLSSDR